MSSSDAMLRKSPASRWWQGLWQRLEEALSRPQAYQWARAQWWTRWVVRRRTLRLFAWMGGFVHSQVLLGCVQLRLFERVATGPLSAAQLAQQLDLPEIHLQPLLHSASAMELLAQDGLQDGSPLYRLGPLGRVVHQHPGIASMVEHNQLLYRDLTDPATFLRAGAQGQLAAYWPYAQDQGAEPALQAQAQSQLQRYSALMDASQSFVITEVLDSYPFGDHQCVLDLGCGKGRFMREVARQHPSLQLQLFDLPAVLALARERLSEAGLAGRAQFHPGSFLDDALPRGADLVTLVRVAHDHSDQAMRHLFRKVAEMLPPGGRLLLAEPMRLDVSQAAVVDPYFHFYLQAMGAGRLRSPQELMALLGESGFVGMEVLPTALPVHAQIVIGHKPIVNPNINPEKSI